MNRKLQAEIVKGLNTQVAQKPTHPCKWCGKATRGFDKWVWSGVNGPFCSVAHRDEWLFAPKADKVQS